MQRIVNGIAFEGKYLPDAFDVRVWENNGHREISARPVVEWSEIGPAPDWSHLGEPDSERDAQDEIDRKEKNQKRASMRAKTACRRFIKSMGFNELVTLTYRENQTDEALCKKHAREWFRRMAAAIPGFGYCAGYEPQERGAWHVHAAVYKLPKVVTYRGRTMEGWRVGTAIWRAIVGKDNGLAFVGGKGNGAQRARNSLAKMAAYVSKYITKHYELMPDGKQRYTHSKGGDIPKPEVIRFVGISLLDLMARNFWCDEDEEIVDFRVAKFKDGYYLCTETPNYA